MSLPRACTLTLILLLSCLSVLSQVTDSSGQQPDHFALSLAAGSGHVFPTNPFVEGRNLAGEAVETHRHLSLKMLWRNPGYQDWQLVFRLPYYGFGFTLADFQNPEEIGYPISIYGVLGFPLIRVSRLSLFAEFQLGLATNWEVYDPVTNPMNISIGSPFVVHVDGNLRALFELTRRVELGAGIHFRHFSNGGLERPNRGFNLWTPSLELKYSFRDHPDMAGIPPAGQLERSNELVLSWHYGYYQMIEFEMSPYYFHVTGLNLHYLLHPLNGFKTGLGIDLSYDQALTVREDGSPGPKGMDNISLGLSWQLECVLDRLSMVGGIGCYARNVKYGGFNKMYQRIGVKYHFTPRFHLGMTVRTIDYAVAEYLEFNTGVRFGNFN